MATQLGKGHIYGYDSGTPLGQSDLAGYVSPKLETLRLSHGGSTDLIMDYLGEVNAAIYSDEYLECTFEVIPENAASVANAKKSAGLPQPGQAFTITGLQVIAVGSWLDALNTEDTAGAPNTYPWFYEGGGTINGFTDGKWTLSLPLRRYVAISTATPVT